MMTRPIVLALILAAAVSAQAGEIARNAGTSGADFLRIEAGARHAAMGGTYAGYGTSVFTLFGQPAAIADRERYEIGFQYNEWVQGVSQQFAGAQMPLAGGRLAITATMLGANGIEKTTDDAFGRFGVSSGTFGVDDYAAAVHYAKRTNPRLALGGAARYIRSEIDGMAADGFSFDLGARYELSSAVELGASVTNIGSGLEFIRAKDDLPVMGRVGAAIKEGRWLLAIDATYDGADNFEGGAGIEWKPVDLIALRAGYKTQHQSDLGEGLTAGLGISVQSFELDYAFVPFGPLGETHRISGAFSF